MALPDQSAILYKLPVFPVLSQDTKQPISYLAVYT